MWEELAMLVLVTGAGLLRIVSGKRSAPEIVPSPTLAPEGGTVEREEVVADVCVHIGLVRRNLAHVTVLRARCLVEPFLALRPQSAAEVARLPWLPEPIRASLLRHLQGSTIEARGGVVTVTTAGRFAHKEQVDEAIAVVAALAGRGMEGIRALRELPGAVYEAPQGPWHTRTLPRVHFPCADVAFALRERDGAAFTAAWTALGRSTGLPGRDDAARAIGAATLSGAGGVLTLEWPAVECDPARLLAGAELLRATAASLRDGRYG